MPNFFAYCRKSLEDEDRQVLSIPSQKTELDQLAEKHRLRIVQVFEESQSAKEPGRPVFGEMMRRLRAGEAEGIICWKLDRLARNPVDGGAVIWSVSRHGIKIITPSQTFQQGDESLLLMYLEVAIAHKFVVDLKKNVTRGLKAKAEMGWKPGYAALGYLNHRLQTDIGTFVEDPERFAIVQNLWKLLLTGQRSVREILDLARNKWNLRGRNSRRRVGKPISQSGLYRLFTDPFYYGEYEYPKGSGCWYKGNHKAMISKAEFDRAQQILGRTNRHRPQKHGFTFVGLMRCGECGRMITAEEKYKRQKNGNVHYYIYYHCTKNRSPRCSQGSIEEKALIAQIYVFLTTFEIPAVFIDWAKNYVRDIVLAEHKDESDQLERMAARSKELAQSLQELTRMRYQRLIEDDEFHRERSTVRLEQSRIEAALRTSSDANQWQKELDYVFFNVFSAYDHFAKSEAAAKRALLAELGSNLVLKDKKLLIEATEPYLAIKDALGKIVETLGPLEPPEYGSVARISPYFQDAILIWCTLVDDVRTHLMDKQRERQKKELGLKDRPAKLNSDLPDDSTIAA